MGSGAVLRLTGLLAIVTSATGQVLTPPYINIAENSKVDASFTCGEGIEQPELYCKLVGANQEMSGAESAHVNIIQGQVCDVCNASDPEKTHPPSAAVDGTESYWMSPPLSRGMEYSQVNFTIDLGQEFHVAYVIIKMGISPKPGVWILEKSSDNGQTYTPWQYFADTDADCERLFGKETLRPITNDDSVICDTRYSKILPLEDGEIVVSLLNDRPSSHDFFNSTVLQEWTRATNVRLRLLQTKTLFAHVMSFARQDPSVTRRYFYSIRDISIGGRCRCNGHADTCPAVDGYFKRVCDCKHNTTGINCERCMENFVQKKWRQSKSNRVFECEECNCHGHTRLCAYNETVDELGLSMDKYGKFEGGGVCQECQDNTVGINCERCLPGYYRPHGRKPDDKNACQKCRCGEPSHTGNCADETGICECKTNFAPPQCDKCAYGYFSYPECKNCTCFIDGTVGGICEPTSQVSECTCKQNFAGDDCRSCSPGYYNFPQCQRCECHPLGSDEDNCDFSSGQCDCSNNYGSLKCDECAHGFYDFPHCTFCKCDPEGSLPEVCDKTSGECLCKPGFGGRQCEKCLPGFKDHPTCQPCGCSPEGSSSTVCDIGGKCSCLEKFSGKTCSQCAFGYYKYPECLPCNCETLGTVKNAQSCDDNAQCKCQEGIVGKRCDTCREGLYNFPTCEECNCDPAGVLPNSTDCGELSKVGELCQCKSRVTGRTCKVCKPLFWNLQHYNPLGCEECGCSDAGVIGSISVCDRKDGQCICKQNVEMRKCDTCVDGTYNLDKSNLFGCTDCSCDIGGALDNNCRKDTGACFCRPRVTGRTCNLPMTQHYFPTLHQFKYELEDGTTPDNRPLNYGYEKDVFPDYSWRGYAIFTHAQNKIRKQVELENSDMLHYIVMRYVNLNSETIPGTILARHEDEEPIELKTHFKPTSKPEFAFTAGAGNIPHPLIATVHGKWLLEITINQSLFIDYLVLIPQSYYEGNILLEDIDTPCTRGTRKACKQYVFPGVEGFDVAYGDSAYVLKNGERVEITDFIEDWHHPLGGSKLSELPELSPASPELRFDLRVRKKESIFLVVDYATPEWSNVTSTISVDVNADVESFTNQVQLVPCPYTWLCRQPLLDQYGKVATFDINDDFITVILSLENEGSVGVESVSLIPYNPLTFSGYLKPSPVCVMRDGKCSHSHFETPVDVKKIEFESGNEERKGKTLPPEVTNNTVLVYLDKEDQMIDLAGKVPAPGNYTFIVHYHQPHHPQFNLDAVIHNGYSYEGILPVVHCPSSSGCRSVVSRNDGNNIYLTENFLLTLKVPNEKDVWLDYILVLPESKFSQHLTRDKQEGSIERFVKECSNNFFYADNNTSEFCKSSIFSLTTHYNNGALRCECHPDGAYSLKCNSFGGQCPCRENIIGMRCERCRTGFYNFPYCTPCDCHENSLCDEVTGQCSCPINVIGEFCDQCAMNTYGYFPQLGCRECECNQFGLQDGNFQCDPTFGTCNCKENVEGRACDTCAAGYYLFPECIKCDCDLRGTTSNICDNSTGQCLCKENVEAEGCDICREGSFNIQAGNRQGCTKCFCFDHSQQCTSSRLYKSKIGNMENWNITSITVKKPNIEINSLGLAPVVPHDLGSLGIDFSSEDLQNKNVYFSVPTEYLGNRLTSYGGVLSYTILTTSSSSYELLESIPELVLSGANLNLLYFSNEIPFAGEATNMRIEITEGIFILSTNFLPASRAQLMQVLRDLRAVHIRATYWKQSSTTRLSEVLLDTGSDEYSDLGLALSVEKCFCEPQYTGLSCEECAPGYYRSQIGPYGGNCVPCQCHGHAATCDKTTGICIDCQHNTTGDHCEMCAEGHYGEARNGSPYDCIICACPLPIPSNNFARSCEVSPNGSEISCECKEGYFGERCHGCALGYYGDPTKEGDGECKLCDCSGNINPDEVGSCDSRTGECLKCLNNTFGEACALCAPGYFGDAVYSKNCQSCVCHKCGTARCEDKTGQCECQPNVTGERCDSCIPDHYGLRSCQGCSPCECGLASEDSQCDLDTGNCKCQPGVTGRTCERCQHGYWNYTSQGCTLCSCNTGYSIGVGCNPDTGECECLPGVIGEKCDHCPHRWVLKPSEGCLECDKCHDDLLDSMDLIHNKFGPFASDFKSFNESFFTRQRVVFINQTLNNLRPNVSSLKDIEIDFLPIKDNLNSVVDDVDKLSRKVEYILDKTNNSMDEKLQTEAKTTNDLVKNAIDKATTSVKEVIDIAESFKNGGAGAQYGYSGSEYNNYLEEAKEILKDLESLQLTYTEEKIRKNELARAEKLLNEMKIVIEPVDNRADAIANISARVKTLESKIEDLYKYSLSSSEKAKEVQEQIEKYRELDLRDKFKTISNLEEACNGSLKDSGTLKNLTLELLRNTSDLSQQLLGNQTEWEALNVEAGKKVDTLKGDSMEDLTILVERCKEKGLDLEKQGEELTRLQNEYQHDSNAVQAYKTIVHILRDALIAADEAKRISENASDTLQGIGDKAIKSKEKSTSLYNMAIDTLRQSQKELEPQLSKAQNLLEDLEVMKDDMQADYDNFESAVSKSIMETSKTSNSYGSSEAEKAAAGAEHVQEQIRDIIEDIPNKLVVAKEIRTNAKDAAASVNETNTMTDNVVSILPDMKELADKLQDRPAKIENDGRELKSKLDELKAQINRARELANNIKVAIRMYPNATLQLRNPPDLPEQGINNKVSVYFTADEPNGLIFFLGNEAHENQRKRAIKTGDFMALELENGNLKLTVDLGAGSTSLICDLDVTDGQWYFVEMERTGKSLKLSVVRLKDNMGCTREGVMKGNTAVLNLDKKHSKLYVGGLPATFNAPHVLNYNNVFIGKLEELRIDGQLVGFWNFQESENVLPATERDVVKRTGSSTGFRFNGDGFVVLNSTGLQLGKKSEILFKFKTFAKEGILFLAPNGLSFLSVELREGRVLFQFELGSGLVRLYASKSYNDGEWHTVEATRYENQGNLKVDGINVDRNQSPGDSKRFQTPEKVFMGGFPGEHNILDITETDFDGCIDEVQIDGQSVDLDKNLEAVGVLPGCPPKFASVVSFERGTRGYVMYPNASAHHNTMELILRFRTSSPDGLLAYADYGEASASLSLSGGQVHFRVGEMDVVRSETSNPYNDSTWHVVMATYDTESLQIFIDDHEKFRSLNPPTPIRMLHGQLYFGGVPSKVNAKAAISKHFSGCISDATLNGVIINFGNLTEVQDSIVGKCVEGTRRQPSHRPPALPPPKVPEADPTSSTVPTTVAPTSKPLLAVENELVVRPDHRPECKVPLYPSSPVEEVEFSAYKIGTEAGSRLEYSPLKIRQKYDFSIDIKTSASTGLIFYVADQRHVDFVAVYLNQGQVHYRFNCGSGPAHITSMQFVNDLEWHTVQFSRQGQLGTLTVDGIAMSGAALGTTKTLNVESPFFVGGIDPTPFLYSTDLMTLFLFNVKSINNSLDGCVREFKLFNQLVGKPSNKVKVTACDTVYNDAYFAPEGGYIKLVEKFRLERRLEIGLTIRARALSGLLLSVHSKESYMIVELVDGEVRFAVDNGYGEVVTTYSPPNPHLLCDGNWHNITALKALNVLTMAVDNNFEVPVVSAKWRKETSSKHTLYLGGHPNIKHVRGVVSRSNFIGCVRNIKILWKEKYNGGIEPKNIFGNVTGGVCPN